MLRLILANLDKVVARLRSARGGERDRLWGAALLAVRDGAVDAPTVVAEPAAHPQVDRARPLVDREVVLALAQPDVALGHGRRPGKRPAAPGRYPRDRERG